MSAAGYRERAYVDLYYTVKLLGPVVAGLIAGFLLRGQNLFIWFLALAAIGFLAPDFWLTSAVMRRRERIRLALPDALDLLVICMEAGLGMDQALIRIGEELRLGHKDLSDELLLIRLEQRAGKPRIEAWRNMANRTGLEIFRSFVNMLVQTERFGTPLSKSLGYFADSLTDTSPTAGGRDGGKNNRQACISTGAFHFSEYVYRVTGACDTCDQQELWLGTKIEEWVYRRSNG